jgi:Fur family ferric uptake transcriptional regulator
MDALNTIYEDLRFKGYRLTRSRRAIVRVLIEADDWLRPEEIHSRARRYCPTLGLVTVYRTLALLSALGYVRRVHREDGCQGYARIELAHSHHLICRSCDQVVEFAGLEDLSALIEPIERKTGYTIDDHMLELLGLCPACQVGESR